MSEPPFYDLDASDMAQKLKEAEQAQEFWEEYEKHDNSYYQSIDEAVLISLITARNEELDEDSPPESIIIVEKTTEITTMHYVIQASSLSYWDYQKLQEDEELEIIETMDLSEFLNRLLQNGDS